MTYNYAKRFFENVKIFNLKYYETRITKKNKLNHMVLETWKSFKSNCHLINSFSQGFPILSHTEGFAYIF